MSKYPECIPALVRAGISEADAFALRRVSMTLDRWHELECGDSNNHASWCITRGRKEGGEFIHDENGKPFEERLWHSSNKAAYMRIADREAGALKRLKIIMVKYPMLGYYIQGDPRGAALYILRPGDVPKGESVDSYYSRGLAVYK